MRRRIAFVSSSRADYGKLTPLMRAVAADPDFELRLFVTGMHLRDQWGHTVNQIRADGWDCFTFPCAREMSLRISDVMRGFSYLLDDYKPDLVVIHGDKAEALGAATAASVQNVRIAHVEGGELSGTIDGVFRHTITKLANVHFVANKKAATMVRSLREDHSSIHVIGSPEVDVMVGELPSFGESCERYALEGFVQKEYGIILYHPVTTERSESVRIGGLIPKAVLSRKGSRWLWILPNDDDGSDDVAQAMGKLRNNSRVRVLPSMRFEYFLSVLHNAAVMVGNSSAGVREAPVYGVPSVNLGTRQRDRTVWESIITLGCPGESGDIAAAIESTWGRRYGPYLGNGNGKSAEKFLEVLKRSEFWESPTEKVVAV